MLCTLGTLTGGLTEVMWTGAHMLAYPIGIRAEQLSSDAPRDSVAPVLLIHGLNDNRSTFMLMRRRLRRDGFNSVFCWNYGTLSSDIPGLATDLGHYLERIRALSGHQRVQVVGHSLGGLIARYHLQRQGGDVSIESLVTLGTPHHGTLLAHLLPTRLGRQLRPGSPLMRELGERAPGCRTKISAIRSDLDQVVVPTSYGRCDHPDLAARNVLVRGVGHLSLPVHPTVVEAVTAALRVDATTARRSGPGPVTSRPAGYGRPRDRHGRAGMEAA